MREKTHRPRGGKKQNIPVCTIKTSPAEVALMGLSQKKWRAVSAVSSIYKVFLDFPVILYIYI